MFKYAHLRATFDLKKFGIPQWWWFWWWFWAAMVFTIWSHVCYYLVSKPMISKTGWHQFQTKVKSTRIIAADLSLRNNPTDQFHMDMKCAQSTTNWDKWNGISNWLKNQKVKITSKSPIFFPPSDMQKTKKIIQKTIENSPTIPLQFSALKILNFAGKQTEKKY